MKSKLAYVPGSSGPHTTALDSFIERRGICRDYAHILIALARASTIPARYVACYAPGVDPPDFHAVAEVFLNDPESYEGGALHIQLGDGHMRFKLKPGEVAMAEADGGYAVAVLTEVRAPSQKEKSDTAEALREELRQGIAGDLFQQFVGALRGRLSIEIDRGALREGS